MCVHTYVCALAIICVEYLCHACIIIVVQPMDYRTVIDQTVAQASCEACALGDVCKTETDNDCLIVNRCTKNHYRCLLNQ